MPLSTEVLCWLELLPLARDNAPLDTLEKMPVLFDVPSGDELALLVLEMLRLGNDRQSYRWLEESDGRAGADALEKGRALLRVIGPPFYSLLRALDQLGGPQVAPCVRQRVLGVWVEVGHRHPLAAHIKPPKGKILLLRPPRQWVLPERRSAMSTRWSSFSCPAAHAPARPALAASAYGDAALAAAGPADGAELWVLRRRHR